MKKLFLVFLLSVLVFASEQFSDKIINLYLSPNSTKAEGKLLPTSAFNIVKKGKMSELVIKGYYNPSIGKILYFTDKNRILVAAFSKKADVKFNVEKDLKNGYFIANVKVFAKEEELKDLQNSSKSLFSKAKKMFEENCGICHPLHSTKEFSANQWPAMFKAMQTRTGIEKQYYQLVILYLQKHAKDM